MKRELFLCLLVSVFSFSRAQNISDKTKYMGDYFGQKLPGQTPVIFLPELFNQFNYLHGRLVFAPNGKEAFWVITTSDKGVNFDKRLIVNQNIDGTWSEPKESFFSIERRENGPCYSSDGNRLYYQSRAPLSGNGENKDIDIWYRERNGEGWSEPINIGGPINTTKDESQPWIINDGSIIFCRTNEKSGNNYFGGSDIYFSKFENGKYLEPIRLGSEINSEYQETEPTMAPDGSFLLFISNRPGGYSRMMNLYVSFRKPNDEWTNAISLSNYLKIDNIWFPTITYDGKYLFFCGGYPTEHGYNNSQYYWVNTDFIKGINSF